MSRNPFGWSLSPGVTQRMIDDAYGGDEGPCQCCGNDPADCICPECPTCGEQGNQACYALGPHPKDHGLQFNSEQLIGQTRMRIAGLREQIADAEYYIQWLKEKDLDKA